MKTKNKYNDLLLLAPLLLLAGCSLLERHPDSGYANAKATTSNSNIRKNSRDSSTAPKAPTSEKARLQNFENGLNTRKEIEQYSKLLPWFKNEEERLEFLGQGSFEQKQQWLNEQNFLARPQQITSEMKELVEAQDITVGMPQSLVKKSWGDPDAIEVSGNPQFRNERWRYNKYVSTNEGYKAEKKSVYFEGGKVVGWEVE